MPVIAWMLVIFSASTDLGSAAQTSRFLIPFLHWLNPQVSPDTIAAVQFAMRKSAHVTEYAILAMLFLRAVRNHLRASFVRQAAVVLVVVGLYAVTDEFHQSFSVMRTASPVDVMIDCCGAVLGVAAYRLLAVRTPPVPALAHQRAG
jgi:VanZ family protein